MSERETTCCFTGHRAQKLPWGSNENDERCKKMKFELDARLDGIYNSGYRHFICGMALGCDAMFAEAVIKLKALHPDVTLEAAVPFSGQSGGWGYNNRERYLDLISHCDEVKVLQGEYTYECMMKRNRYMVDSSSVLLACFNGSTGGTMNTIRYAYSQDVKVILIDI